MLDGEHMHSEMNMVGVNRMSQIVENERVLRIDSLREEQKSASRSKKNSEREEFKSGSVAVAKLNSNREEFKSGGRNQINRVEQILVDDYQPAQIPAGYSDNFIYDSIVALSVKEGSESGLGNVNELKLGKKKAKKKKKKKASV